MVVGHRDVEGLGCSDLAAADDERNVHDLPGLAHELDFELVPLRAARGIVEHGLVGRGGRRESALATGGRSFVANGDGTVGLRLHLLGGQRLPQSPPDDIVL